MEKENFMSLYDYLGRAAGSELGKQVAEYAKLRKASFNKRYVSNTAYKGEVLLYHKSLLDEFFKAKQILTQ